MVAILSKSVDVAWIALVVTVMTVALTPPAWSADEGTGDAVLADRLGEVFHRSMMHWKFTYSKMPDRKAGVACIPWQRLDAVFLDKEIFEALGFSYSMADDSGAISVATQGCNRMKNHYKVTDCVCEVVLLGDEVTVAVPEGSGH